MTKEQRAEQKCIVLQSKERQARERREKAEQELAFMMQQQQQAPDVKISAADFELLQRIKGGAPV